MRFGSLFSGIEGASVAWEPLGWKCQFVAELDPFASAVLAHHYPHVPNLGDVTKVDWNSYRGTVDVLIAGPPCQDYPLAGNRAGMDGSRGSMSFEFLRIVEAIQPRYFIFENVPGLLSSNKGRDFAAFLGDVGERGYGWAYSVLDAKNFGVPQRRRRVFVVGHLGDWRRAAAVLFERESLRGNPTQIGKEKEDVALCVTSRFGSGRNDPTAETYIPVAFQCHGNNVGEMGTIRSGNGGVTGGVPFMPVAFSCKDYGADAGDTAPTLRSMNFTEKSHINGGGQVAVTCPPPTLGVRRLMPSECEKLQGFSGTHTLIPYGRTGKLATDTPRYRAIGNSFAVPCIRWLGQRIRMVEDVT